MTKPKPLPQPVLENVKYERLAQELVDGRTQVEAWLIAENPDASPEEREQIRDEQLRERGSVNLNSAAGGMCRRNDVRQRVNTLLAERSAKRLAITMKDIRVNSAWVNDRLTTVVDRCMQTIPCKNGQGDVVGQFRFDSGGAVKALELLGLEQGMFERKHKHLHAKANPLDGNRIEIVGRLGVLLDQLSDADLKSIGLQRLGVVEIRVERVDGVGEQPGSALPALPEAG
jgi:phage terminase small subunit